MHVFFLEFWVRVLELDMLCIVLYETTSQFKWSQDDINGIMCLDRFGYFYIPCICRCRCLFVLRSCFCRMLAGVVGSPKVLHLGKQANPEKIAARLHANSLPSTYGTRNRWKRSISKQLLEKGRMIRPQQIWRLWNWFVSCTYPSVTPIPDLEVWSTSWHSMYREDHPTTQFVRICTVYDLFLWVGDKL